MSVRNRVRPEARYIREHNRKWNIGSGGRPSQARCDSRRTFVGTIAKHIPHSSRGTDGLPCCLVNSATRGALQSMIFEIKKREGSPRERGRADDALKRFDKTQTNASRRKKNWNLQKTTHHHKDKTGGKVTARLWWLVHRFFPVPFSQFAFGCVSSSLGTRKRPRWHKTCQVSRRSFACFAGAGGFRGAEGRFLAAAGTQDRRLDTKV